MANIVSNLETFLSEIDSFVDTKTVKDGRLIVEMKPSILATPDNYKIFLQTVNPLKKKLRLEYYIEHKGILKPAEAVNESNKAFPYVSFVVFDIDLTALHMDRLKDYFQNGTTKEDVAASIGLLQKIGWTNKDLQKEIGIPSTTFFRYVPKSSESPQAAASPENQAPLQ